MNFTALTISMRHELIPWVGKSVSSLNVPHDVDFRWVVKMNPPFRIPWNRHIELWDNEIRRIRGSWVILLSDDNAIHPDVVTRCRELVAHSPQLKMIHVRQQHGPCAFRPAGLDHLRGGHCDGGQILFEADYYNSFGWSYGRHQYEGDLFREIHDYDPAAFAFHDETLSYHDRINW